MRNIAEHNKKIVGTHPSWIASAENSAAIWGRARLTIEPMNGVRNDPSVEMIRIKRSHDRLSDGSNISRIRV
jgi:hypothetical protein